MANCVELKQENARLRHANTEMLHALSQMQHTVQTLLTRYGGSANVGAVHPHAQAPHK
jgi:hypothetical protein